MKTIRPFLILTLILSMFGLTSSASAAGRIPYGGKLAIGLKHFNGITQPKNVRDFAGRWAAMLAHCRLVNMEGDGFLHNELGHRFYWDKTQGTLTISLNAGAAFHDNSPITAHDVLQSLKGVISGRNVSPWIRKAVLQLKFQRFGNRSLRIKMPGKSGLRRTRVLRALLARPEFAIVKGGLQDNRPAIGCGPFRPQAPKDNVLLMTAHSGHPWGRPWLDGVSLRKLTFDAEEGAFLHKQIDLTRLNSFRYKRPKQRPKAQRMRSHSSILLAFSKRNRRAAMHHTRKSMRHALTSLDLKAAVRTWGRLRADPRLWPPALAPSRRFKTKLLPAVSRADFIIRYDSRNKVLDAIAPAVQHHLTKKLGFTVRMKAVAAPVTVADVLQSPHAAWDAALVIHDWAALTREQAALEAQVLMGLDNLSLSRFFRGKVRRWATQIDRQAHVIPLAHIERRMISWGDHVVIPGRGNPDLDRSYNAQSP